MASVWVASFHNGQARQEAALRFSVSSRSALSVGIGIDISRSRGAPAPLKGGGNGERRHEEVVAKAPAFPARPEVFDRVGLQPAVLSVPSRD